MHGADVDIGFAGYGTNSSHDAGSVKMGAEEEIAASGDNIHPEIIDLNDVSLIVSNCA